MIGLLIKYDGGIFLGKYNNSGHITSFRGLNNSDAYNSLTEQSVAIVDIYENNNTIKLKELQRIYIDFDKIPDLMENKGIYEFANQLYESIVKKYDL